MKVVVGEEVKWGEVRESWIGKVLLFRSPDAASRDDPTLTANASRKCCLETTGSGPRVLLLPLVVVVPAQCRLEPVIIWRAKVYVLP